MTPRAASSGIHVAVIMDGNGRWAVRRGLPRTAGHRAGVRSVRELVEAAIRNGVQVLTLYAFSSDNWRRPPAEVGRLMSLFAAALRKETAVCLRQGIRLSVIGRRDRLPPTLAEGIDAAERATAGGGRLHLRVAVDYSARAMIARAASLQEPGECSEDHFASLLARAQHEQSAVPPVDLLIRTGGEQRLSDFLLWECAYAELVFTATLWPDFRAPDLLRALQEFHGRDRRFGGVPLAASA